MKFCPKCESLLYPFRDNLYCKICQQQYEKETLNLIKRAVKNEVLKPEPKMKKELEFVPKKFEIKPLRSKINYLQFFPYAQFREKQEKIIKQIEDSAREKKNILLLAPNGTGKTIISLSALLPLAIEKDLKIIYMCRTHSQNTRIIKELTKINYLKKKTPPQIQIRGLSIRGRNEMCLNETLLSLKLKPKESMSVCGDLRKNKNCRYFLNLNKKRSEYDNSIDNVIDMATEINSDRITPYSLRICLKDLEIFRSPSIMQRFVKVLLSHLEKKKKSLRVAEIEIKAEDFLLQVYSRLGLSNLNDFKNLVRDLHNFSISIHDEKVANGDISRDFVGALAEFWLKWMRCYLLDNFFFCYNLKRVREKPIISIEIVALDPRDIVIPILKECYTSVHLSGTVNPYVYNNLMGLRESGKSYKGIVASSPFKKENIKAIITEGVDTRRASRTGPMFKKMLSKIDEVIYSTPANIGIFCASYKVLNALVTNGIESIANKNKKQLFIEEPGLSASENAFLVNDFKSMASPSRNGAVLLGVCGGRNSEGEDYPGDYMNSVIVAGFPYHLPTPRVNAKIEYYDKAFNKQGWNFAYLYPAVQRANQASGRPIRKLKDKGAIIFMDFRFKQKYKWISEWIRKELEVVPDKEGVLIKNLYPFWHS